MLETSPKEWQKAYIGLGIRKLFYRKESDCSKGREKEKKIRFIYEIFINKILLESNHENKKYHLKK